MNTSKLANAIIVICIISLIGLVVHGANLNKIAEEEKAYFNQNVVKEEINNFNGKNFRLLMSTENQDLEDELKAYAKSKNFNLAIDYAGTLDVIQKLNAGEKYDAVWSSNSIWLYMLDKSVVTKNSKSTSINPIVFGIKKSKAEELGFVGKDVYMKDLLDAISSKKLSFNMSSATQTNSGASAYLGFISTLAGNPEILTEEMLHDPDLQYNIIQLLSGVERSSGSEEFLEEMFVNGNYDSVVTYETSLIRINKELVAKNKEPLYLIYPVDGVSISDSPLAYINNSDSDKEDIFNSLQSYVLSDNFKSILEDTGRRVWYGGVNTNVDKRTFNPEWGIDTTKYINAIKYPSTKVIRLALELYQSELKKPTHTVFVLDYSGSMVGEGIEQLIDAMKYILTEERASENYLQFSSKDKITIIPFNSKIIAIWDTKNGKDTESLINHIEKQEVIGGTNIYDSAIKGIEILSQESDDYNTSVVLMTDGYGNVGTFKKMEDYYNKSGNNIPVYSIMFGEASAEQLNEIATLTNAKVFDGRTNLLEAFMKVRGYN